MYQLSVLILAIGAYQTSAQGCCTGTLSGRMYGAFPEGLGWSTQELEVYAHNGNYSVYPSNSSLVAGMITRPDLGKQFVWTGDKCIAAPYSQTSPPFCTGTDGFWSTIIKANVSIAQGVSATQFRPASTPGWTINMWYSDEGCWPISQVGGETTLSSWQYYDLSHDVPAPSLFELPSFCAKAAGGHKLTFVF